MSERSRAGPAVCRHQLQHVRLHQLQRRPVRPRRYRPVAACASSALSNLTLARALPGRSRQFNHRCKGISMATFKPEEMRAIEEGGNAVRPPCVAGFARTAGRCRGRCARVLRLPSCAEVARPVRGNDRSQRMRRLLWPGIWPSGALATCQSRQTGAAPARRPPAGPAPSLGMQAPTMAAPRRTVSKVRDFIEIVFVKKRFADEHAPVPGGLARLPARPRGPRHCARLAPLPSRLQRAAGAARRPGAAPRAPAVPVRWQPEPAESGGAARAVHQQRAVVHVAGNRCGGAATRAVRRSGACASAPLLAR